MLKRADSALSVGSSHPSETPRSGFSSFGTRVPSISSRDAALYSLAQGLVPVINDPTVQSHLSPAWCWPFGGNSDSFTTPPPPSHGLVYEVTLQDFRRYMRVMADNYNKFEANLRSLAEDEQIHTAADPTQGDMLPSQGDGLAQSMRQVPTQYFTEEFSLSRPETWREVCPSDTEEDRQEAMDQLSGYLDVVETHLLRDIAARSENFFQAASVVQDLRGVLARTYTQVKALRQEVHLLDTEVLEAAVLVQQLQRRRNNLKNLQHKLQVVEHVKQSQEALGLLLPQGDYAGALDIMTDIQNTVQREGVHQMHCFRRLPQQLQEAGEAVQQLMSSDLLSLLRAGGSGGAALQDPLLAAIMQNQEIAASGQLTERGQYRLQSEDGGTATVETQASNGASSLMNGFTNPLTHLLSVGRAATDSMQPDSAEADEMAQLVTPLVLGLRRTGGLSGVLKSYREAMALEVKQAIRDVVEQALPPLLGSRWPTLQHHSLADKLQAVSAEGFLWLLASVLCVSQACLQQCKRVRALLEEGLKGGRTPRTQWAPLLQDMQEAGQAVSEVAHGRWAKLLASRAAANNEMQMRELKQVLRLCDDFARMAGSFGCRPVPALQAAVQLQCKAYLEHLHHHTLTHLTGALEQESWAAVPAPHDSQQLVDDWAEQAQRLKPMSPSKLPPVASDKTSVADTDQQDDLGRNGVTAPIQASTSKEPPTPTAKQSPKKHDESVLRLAGQRFHVAHTALLLLRMLQSYMTFQETVPSLVAETARRAVDLLKVFNSRMCQLVLGAGAMQVSGLRSITAKHLALSSQCLSVYMALQPLLKALLTPTLPGPRLALLLPEFDRLLQDLSMHKEEIHSKLVAIMRERLATNLKQLPLIASSWTANSPPKPNQLPPSNFAQSSAKQLRILSQVLSPILLPSDLHSIFGRVAALFSKNLAEAFTRLEPRGMFWEAQCGADLRHMLHTLENLPMDPSQGPSNIAPLSLLCSTRFAALPTMPAQPSEGIVPRQLHRSLTEGNAHTHKPRSPVASPKRLDTVVEATNGSADGAIPSTHEQQESPSTASATLNGMHNGHLSADSTHSELQPVPAAVMDSSTTDAQSANLIAELIGRERETVPQQQLGAAQSELTDREHGIASQQQIVAAQSELTNRRHGVASQQQLGSAQSELTDRGQEAASQQQPSAAHSHSTAQQSDALDNNLPSNSAHDQPMTEAAQQAAAELDKAADQIVSTDQNGELDMVATSITMPVVSENIVPVWLTPLSDSTDHDRTETSQTSENPA